MAILLKELTIRYSPQGGSYMQALMDYHAIFSVWQKEGSGGAAVSPTSQRKTELIDDLIEQVAAVVMEKITSRMSDRGRYGKDLKKMRFAFGQKNWLDFTAAISNLTAMALGTDTLKTTKKLEINPKAELSRLSKVIQPFVKSTLGFPDVKPKEPAWKKYDKPMTGAPAAIQRDLPFAGAQTDLPLKPREKLPSIPADLPPMATPFAGSEPKKVPANWERVLARYGYVWSDHDGAYKNAERNIAIRQQANGVFTVSLPSGKTKEFRNLGLLLRRLQHNREKRNKEPVAQVTESDYRDLYRFLYD